MRRLRVITVLVTVSIIGAVSAGRAQQPQYGGVLTMIQPAGPQVLGYYPEMGPTDLYAAFPCTERMMDMNDERKIVPFLAESVDVSEKRMTMTFHLRKGVKFHDGSDMNAQAVAWNYQLYKDTKKMQFADQIKSIEVVDPLTVVLHLSSYHNQLIFAYGWIPIFSKVAYETKGKEWCRAHPVGTGPFKLAEWVRDDHIKWEKFDGYWQKGRPYLDGIEVRYVPEAMTASAMMQAKEADVWVGPEAKDQAALEKQGFIRKAYWASLPAMIYVNTKNPNGPMANLKVREAVEYAIDKGAIAKAVGFGYYTPLKMMHPEGEWAYDPDWPGRPYNPAKARQLLADAGYAKGLKLKLLAVAGIGGGQNTATAVKAYLADVGIDVDVDMADPGRYFGSLFGTGWDDMILSFNGIDLNSLGTIEAWYGHKPKTSLASLKISDTLLAMSRESVMYKSEADQAAAARKMSRYISEEALLIPLFSMPAAYVVQPWVHTDYLKQGVNRWKMFDIWMDKH